MRAQKETIYDTYAEDKKLPSSHGSLHGEVLGPGAAHPHSTAATLYMECPRHFGDSLNEDERKPLYNRFRQKLCPGSSFKPVIAAIGLETGAIDPDMDYGNEGLQWQKDASWGKYYVTTLHAYDPVILENALIYSDNIYFAKAALRIGSDKLTDGLDKLGFGNRFPLKYPWPSPNIQTVKGLIRKFSSRTALRTGRSSGKSPAPGSALYRLCQQRKCHQPLPAL